MKKFMLYALCSALFLGCSGMIEPEVGSNDLVLLKAEPIGCQFLYKLESEVSVYDSKDAEQYLRNRIADQVRRGNAYWIVSERTRPNDWVVFGPERAFIYTANVYSCPDTRNIRTRADSSAAVEFYSGGDSQYGVYGGTM
ncbi:MAG: hypothetical protein LBK26_00780 [Rickettsiales bacterium]|jgi:hypothetical protein|nr:hypothetical protein [Rickettsiales bacterium]